MIGRPRRLPLFPHPTLSRSQPGNWSSNRVTYNRPLPSLFVNYRPSNDTVYRGSIWTSYTRPPFVQLGGGSQIHVSPDGTSDRKSTRLNSSHSQISYAVFCLK